MQGGGALCAAVRSERAMEDKVRGKHISHLFRGPSFRVHLCTGSLLPLGTGEDDEGPPAL